jgi:UDP-N-acetylglucosamine:LPS N-acetylglucosamine transferase
LEGEPVDWAFHPTTRNVTNLIRNLGLAWRIVRRERPMMIVTTGAGVALPFFLTGKLFGAKTVYIEVYDRIDTRTLTGRLCYPLTDRFLLQWEEQRTQYPKGIVVGPLL